MINEISPLRRGDFFCVKSGGQNAGRGGQCAEMVDDVDKTKKKVNKMENFACFVKIR